MKSSIYNPIFMDRALEQAKIALKNGEVPIGAIIVKDDGEIIGIGCNSVEADKCQISHAEVHAIRQASNRLNNWRLEGSIMYVTLEPCLMCFGLITLSRIKAIFYGASSPLFGCDLDNKDSFTVYKKDLMIGGGYKREESVYLLQQFFQSKRTKTRGDV